MIALIQRVSRASVTVADEVTGEIARGFWCCWASRKTMMNKRRIAFVNACLATASSAMRKEK